MALSIKINKVERAQDVSLRSLRLGNALTADVDTADFHVKAGDKPQEGQEVVVEDVALEAVVDTQADWQAGTIPAEADVATNPGAVTLKGDGWAVFDDAFDKISLDGTEQVNLTGPYTVRMRFRPRVATQTDYCRLATKYDGTTLQYFLAYDMGGKRLRYLVDTSTGRFTAAGGVADNVTKVYEVVATYTGSQIALYLDGAEVARVAVSGVLKTSTAQPITIGRDAANTSAGALVDVYGYEIWEGTFTPAQLPGKHMTGSEAGLIGLWKLDEGQGSTAYDSTPNARHGTLSSVTWGGWLYDSAATITTMELDLGAAPERSGALQVTAVTPAGTAVEVTEVRNRWPGGDWAPWTAVEPGGIIPATMERRQIWQAKVNLSTTDTAVTPELQQLRLVFDEDSENGREFGGRVVTATQLEPIPGAVQYQVRCNDWMKAGDRRLVNGERFVNWTRGAIARYLVGKYAAGFTATVENVPDGPAIAGDYRIDYRRLSDVFRELCQMTAGDWYWDPYKGLHMFDVGSEQASAPFRLSDDGAADAEHPANLSWTPDVTDLGTRVYVRGGDYFPPNSYPQTIPCDGQARAWWLAYKPKDLVVAIEGDPTPQTVAVDDLLNQTDNPDWTFNFQEKLLKRGPGKPTPAAGTVLNLTYRPFLPVRLRLDDNDAQQRLAAIEGGDGVYEATIVDESLDSVEQARLVGEAYLREHANALITGGYSTLRKGLRAGQKQTVQLAARGISQDILIGAVMKERLPGGRWRSSVVFASRLIGGIEDLILRLLRDSRKIEIRDDEILEIVVAMKSAARGEDSLTVAVVPRESRVEYARANRSEVS